MNNNLSPRQTVEELRRFVNVAEASLNSNLTAKHQAVALTEVSALLTRLRDQFSLDRQKHVEFVSEFVSKPNNGVELLLRVLSVLQRLLHEVAQQPPASKFSTLLNRNGSTSNRRRKTGVAEADCLECLKLLGLQMPDAIQVITEHVTYVEIILISITSPQLDSKCFALEVITQIVNTPGGFMSLFKALTSVAGKNRDTSRLALVVSQLKHGLNTSKLHIQILVTRFLNAFLTKAPNLNFRVIMQSEAENAGFNADGLEKVVAQYGRQPDFNVLKRELVIWKNAYLPLVWLQGKAQEYTFDYSRRSNTADGSANGDVSRSGDYVGYRYDSGTIPRPRAPVTKEAIRQQSKKKRVNGGSSEPSSIVGNSSGRWSASNGSLISEGHNRRNDGGGVHLETNPSYVPYPFKPESVLNNNGPKPGSRQSKQKNEGILKRPKSESSLLTDNNSVLDQGGPSDPFHRRTPREEEIFRQYNSNTNTSNSSAQFSMPVLHEYTRQDPRNEYREPSKKNYKSQSVDELNLNNEKLWTIPIKRVHADSRPEPEGRSVMRDERLLPPGGGHAKLERTLSNASEKAKMQGFSYLFPNSPVLEQIPVRRAKTPTALQEEVYSRSSARPSDFRYSERRRSPTSNDFVGGGNSSKLPAVEPYRGAGRKDDVIYIPVRVEETGQLLTRPAKKSASEKRGGASRTGATSNPNLNIVHRYELDSIAEAPANKSSNKQSYQHRNDADYGRRHQHHVRNPTKAGSSHSYGDDVEDALKRFDYLNDYSVEEGSRSSRYAQI